MPGLLRGMARTAVIAGTATAVSNNVSRRQARRWAEQETVEAPTATQNASPAVEQAASQSDPMVEQLEQLAKLKDQGILTQEEFDAKKKQILGL